MDIGAQSHLKFPMIGGDSKCVLTRTHVHMFPHTHTQLISRNGKEIEITHTRQMGVEFAKHVFIHLLVFLV